MHTGSLDATITACPQFSPPRYSQKIGRAGPNSTSARTNARAERPPAAASTSTSDPGTHTPAFWADVISTAATCNRPSDPQATLRRLCVWTSSFRRSDHHARSHRYRAPWPRTPSGALLSPTSKAMWSAQSGPQGRSQLEPFPLWPSVPDSLFKPDSILTNSQVSRGQPSIRRTARRIAYEDLANLNLMF